MFAPDLDAAFVNRNASGSIGRHGEITDRASYLMSGRSGYITGESVA